MFFHLPMRMHGAFVLLKRIKASKNIHVMHFTTISFQQVLPRDNFWHDGCISHSQIGDPMNFQSGI